ncbi:hypothetical protein [Epinotia aporema granulovirus]|uniref:Uncharacterized protein n=1 Tax=Epinotia aporema granulovirus TaxID=166056 RepID=K4EQE6_9BBAC|nr:hypothetical protein [Epinotia aporema granulovirus]AER41493.1 hypothetical protein [Epinotia aporema granulovirus]
MNFALSVYKNVTGLFSCNERLEQVEIDLPLLKETLINIEAKLDSLLYKLLEDDEFMLHSRASSNHSTRSNLAIFVKPKHNDHTQIQYVTGDAKTFATRKNIYSSCEMEMIDDRPVNESRHEIAKINRALTDNGYNITTVSENSLLVDCNYNTLKDIINNVE